MIRRISALIVLAWLVTTGHGDDTPGITLIPRGPGEITVKENRYTKLREKATIDQQLGAQLSPDINFLDHEGKPVALMEAMALGLPSVVTPSGALPEAINHGVDGWVCRDGSAPAIAEGLAHFLASEDVRQLAGAAARRSADDFSPERFANAWAAVFAAPSTVASPRAEVA